MDYSLFGLSEANRRDAGFAAARGDDHDMTTKDCVICLGFPPFHAESYLERMRALPGVEPLILPIDPDADWVSYVQDVPYAEPPPWAESVAQERREALARADAIVTLQVPEKLLDLAPNLRWIQGAGAGMEQFSSIGARQRGILMTNASGVSSASIAEFVIGRLFQVWKRFREADAFQGEHVFERSYGASVRGKTVGIVGLGSIGRAISERLGVFDCRILGLTRSARTNPTSEFAERLYPPEALHEMLAECDAVVVAAPASAETYRMIDASALDAMPPHSILVNVARGSLVDEAALAAAMREEKIAAAVLDVFDPEPLAPESPLWDLPNVYVSAHSAVAVDRYMDDLFDFFFENLKCHVEGRPLSNVLDLESMGFS